jgi:Fe-S-cluster containining protein
MELAKFVADWRRTVIAQGGSLGPAIAPGLLPLANKGANKDVRSEVVRSRSLPLFDQANVTPVVKPGCPFQVDGLCGVHGIRPFGCRIFFCDETSTAWQHEMYERLHGRLRALHDELQVPYFYVEWRFALRAIMLLTTDPG